MSQQWYDPSKFNEALDVALRAARADPDEDAESMEDFVHSAAHRSGSATTYRPFEAAAAWLGSDAYRLAKSKNGVTFTDNFEGVKAELRAQQRAEDKRLGLLPESASSSGIFAGLAR